MKVDADEDGVGGGGCVPLSGGDEGAGSGAEEVGGSLAFVPLPSPNDGIDQAG
jgi:hypothetical protein